MNVKAVEAKGEKAAIIVMDDGTRIWTPEKDKADALIGKPIPADWTRKEGNYGPQAFPPRDKNAPRQSSWQNSEAGVRFIQDRTDRRTALMQAVALLQSVPWGERLKLADEADGWGIDILAQQAYEMYAWLQEPAGTAGTDRPSAAAHEPTSSTAKASVGAAADTDGAGGSSSQEAVAAPCAHRNTSPLRPDGSPMKLGMSRCLDCGKVVAA